MPVQITDRDSRHVLVSGQGLIYGDNGSGMPPFTQRTDFMLGLVPHKPVLFEHGSPDLQGACDGPLGEVINEVQTAGGVWIDALLDLSAPGVADLLPDIEAGKMGWSPGAHLPLLKLYQGAFVRWGIVEWSLTRNPRDWRIMYRQRVNHAPQRMLLIAQDGLLYEAESGRVIDAEEIAEFDFHGLEIVIRCEDGSVSEPPGFTTYYTNQ